MMSKSRPGSVWVIPLITLLFPIMLFTAPAVRADGLLDWSPDTASDNLSVLFPNWLKVPVAQFALTMCTDAVCPWCTAGTIVGLTIYNYGTAAGGTDISGVYFRLVCAKTDSSQTMTWAGVWTVGASNYPAWTWAGNIPWASDPQFGCASTPALSISIDVGPCPVPGSSVTMGLGFNEILTPAAPGGLWDSCGYNLPNYNGERVGKTKFIQYVVKTADRQYVAPGDTVTYTVYYGRPGAAITGITVMDSLPTDTHYVAGSGVPLPDPGYDPDPGPPSRLRWSLPGFASSAGGATSELRFSASIDWGNGEVFEPGSGDSGAVEGSRASNIASVEFLGAGCGAKGTAMNPPVDAVIRRYLMWKVADQDLLFAPRVGYPDDEIIYSIFMRNESSLKTWWKVRVWDTVPDELTTWNPGFGFWDPCTGWTMTPSGCADGTPGFIANASRTLLTWTIDLPPSATMSLMWKAAVKSGGVSPNSTAISKVSVMALGDPGKAGGSGSARAPRYFTHIAPIVLRTTYFSYVGQVTNSKGGAGLKINFYPLNKATAFELRKLYYEGAGFASVGGKSASITALQGTCAGGFADGGYGGCGAERTPAQYFWLDSSVAAPNAALYKMTSNAPLLWILMPEIGGGGDAITYLPSTSLHHSGFALYSFKRTVTGSTDPGWGETWIVFNTGLDAKGVFNPDQTTTVHMFKWDLITQSWQYFRGEEIDKNSLWMPTAGTLPSDEAHYRIISSDCRLLVYQGYGSIGDPNITYDYNDDGTMVPNAETGVFVSQPGGPATFYPVGNHDVDNTLNMAVGCVDAATKGTYRVYHYRPRNPALATIGNPPSLCGSSGTWDLAGIRTADAGLAGPDNPNCYGPAATYDQLTRGSGSAANAWKIEWQSGGAIQAYCGSSMFRTWAGGSGIHTANGKISGQEFWMHHCAGESWALTAFCHSANMAVNCVSGDGFSATYTTDGPDQCISFVELSTVGWDGHRAYKISLLATGAQGELMCQYHQAEYREKFFTAPFVNTGTHYEILAPPTVFSGQPFWITVVVVLGSGTTKVDYCGTSSFTSTDPLAQIAGSAMDTYNFTWSSASTCSAAPDENGVKLFFNVILNRLGPATIMASDISDGSITGIVSVMVIAADVKLIKRPLFSIAASGDKIQFRVCWSNYSSASAFTFVITDAVPVGTTYLPEAATSLVCGAPAGITTAVAYSTATDATAPAAFTTVSSGNLPVGVRWLRWTVQFVGVNTTGCACYRITVD